MRGADGPNSHYHLARFGRPFSVDPAVVRFDFSGPAGLTDYPAGPTDYPAGLIVPAVRPAVGFVPYRLPC